MVHTRQLEGGAPDVVQRLLQNSQRPVGFMVLSLLREREAGPLRERERHKHTENGTMIIARAKPTGQTYVCRAHRLLYHSTLGLRVIKKKEDTRHAEHVARRRLAVGSEEGSYVRLIDLCITQL